MSSAIHPPSVPMLFARGALAAGLGVVFASWLFPLNNSLMCVFLASLSAGNVVNRLLDHNRLAIYDLGIRPVVANLRLVTQVLALFLGTVCAFSAFAMMDPVEVTMASYVTQLRGYDSLVFSELVFGSTSEILANNLYVVLFFFLIAIPFHEGGVMLVIAWNGSVWGATFGTLATRWVADGGPPLAEAFMRVIISVMPHLVFEACGYVLAGMAGVFLSKALRNHALDSPVLVEILRSVSLMVAIALALIIIGAVWESTIAGRLVAVLS